MRSFSFLPRRRRALGAGLLGLAGTLPLTAAAQSGLPQLGKAPLAEVLAALTPAEKVQLVVGMGFYPSGFPAGALPPGNPGDREVPEKVPGAAGRTHAVPRLGIPSLTLADGPAGVRIDSVRTGDPRTFYATGFPTATLLASTWDTVLVRRVGAAFGGEAREFGVDVVLAPGMNIHRNPLGGRNFEYYSEDPLLTGHLAAALVTGVQSRGVGTSIKHFAANEEEFNRMLLDAQVGERALREIYLRGFQLTVQQARPWTVMSSYNLLNGTYTSQSRELLTDLLRQEWGYKGLVMSDWYGGKNPVAQLQAGNDLLMPGTYAQTQAILAALQSGQLTPAQLDDNVRRMLELVLKSPTFGGYRYGSQPPLKADAAVARQAAAEGLVLLRNEGGTLPLAPGRRVALFGNAAYELIAGGTGSGDVNRPYTASVARGLAAAGFGLDAGLGQTYAQFLKAERARQPKRTSIIDPPTILAELLPDSAVVYRQVAATDVSVLTLGRNAGEGGDRKEDGDFTLTATERRLLGLVARATHAAGHKLVVVLNVGGVVEVASWRHLADALLLAWQPGQEGGYAIADVLGGRVNPSGRLATTFPVAYRDVPYAAEFPGRVKPGAAPAARAFTGQDSETTYKEGIYVGYRYYDAFGVTPAYEFGYGLSYTTFGYGPLKLSATSLTGAALTATLTVTNTGRVPGREVVQLYVGAPAGVLPKPVRELKAFAKTALLAPGQAQTLSFRLTPADLASFDPAVSAWVAAAGPYSVQAGASSRRIRQQASFQLPTRRVVQQSRPLLRPQAPISELQPRAGK